MIRVKLGKNSKPGYFRIEDSAVFADLGEAVLLLREKGFAAHVLGGDFGDDGVEWIGAATEGLNDAGAGNALLDVHETVDGPRALVQLPAGVDWNVAGVTSGEAKVKGKVSTVTTYQPIKLGDGMAVGHGMMAFSESETLAAAVMITYDLKLEIEVGQFLIDLGNGFQNGMVTPK